MKRLLHILALVVALALAWLVPYRLFIGPIRLPGSGDGGVDAVSSASVILDAPSGRYVVLLNERAHRRYDTAGQWAAFFAGDSLVIMDDVDCMVADGDPGGRQLAESYRSRLPENQMKLRVEDGLMMLSRAEADGFDAIVMSREYAEAMRASTIYGHEGIRVIEIGGEAA